MRGIIGSLIINHSIYELIDSVSHFVDFWAGHFLLPLILRLIQKLSPMLERSAGDCLMDCVLVPYLSVVLWCLLMAVISCMVILMGATKTFEFRWSILLVVLTVVYSLIRMAVLVS